MANIKSLNSEQLKELKDIVIKNGYISNKQVLEFSEKFNFLLPTFRKKLKENLIPFVYQYLNSIFIPYNIIMENNKIFFNDFMKLGTWRSDVFKNSNISVKFNCENCEKFDFTRLECLINRKYFKEKPLCYDCIMKLIHKNEEYNTNISVAQKKSKGTKQNKEKVSKQMAKMWQNEKFRLKTINAQKESMKLEETIQKMSDAQKKIWADDTYRQKMSDIRVEMWKDIDYRDKIDSANFLKFGKKSIAQTDNFFDNNKSFKKKEYIMPSGKSVNIQGYEDKALDVLLKEHKEENLIIGAKNIREKIGEIYYEDKGIQHRYFPDIYIISENKIVEVKSTWTYAKYKNINILKKNACLSRSINFEFIIFERGMRKIIAETFVYPYNFEIIKLGYKNFVYFILK